MSVFKKRKILKITQWCATSAYVSVHYTHVRF